MNAEVTPVGGRGISHIPLNRRVISVPMPCLKIIPLDSLILHEETDPHRWERLMSRLADDDMLLNPPIVTETGEGRYMVLDGANRVMALTGLGMTCTLAQIVEPTEPFVRLGSWHHLLMYCTADEILDGLSQLGPVILREIAATDIHKALSQRGNFAVVRAGDGNTFVADAGPDSDLLIQAALLRQMVAIYRQKGPFERVAIDDMIALREHYPTMKALVTFQTYRHDEIVRLVRAGGKLPSGITRYVIHGRAMRLKYPLNELRTRDLEEANKRLQNWIEKRFASRAVRFYADSMFIFDEYD